jgi:Phage-related minor tail protein
VASTLKLQIDVDTKGAEKLSGIGAGLQRTGLNLTKFLTVPLLGAGAASLALAADAEKSTAKLNAAYKNMGKTSGRTLEQLTEQAQTLGDTTIFDDEQFAEAQAALLTFGTVSGESFDRAIEAASNYAAATGQELVPATQALGKALADPEKGIARLARAGVILTDSQKDQIASFLELGDKASAQEVILGAFEDRYRGVNDALQSTAAGQAAQAFEDLKNAGEQIGAVFLPVLANLAKGFSTLLQWFLDLPQPIKDFVATFGVVLALIGPAVFVVGKLVGAFQGVITVFNLLKLALLTNPFVALAVAVAAIAALIILNWDKIWAFLKAVWENIKKALGGLVDFFTEMWTGLVKATTDAWNAVVSIIKGVINGIIDVINGLFGFLNGIAIGIPEINVGPVHVGGGTIDPFNIPLIPHLAEGGIIDSPTLALIGEAGSEAVVPLDKAGSLGSTHFHSHIEVKGEDPFIRNEDDLIRTNQRIAFLEGF